MDCEGTQEAAANQDEQDRLLGDPSRAEILEACERIRSEWSPRRRATRAGFSRYRLQSVACPFTHDGRPLRIE
jgi:hypothetical protein